MYEYRNKIRVKSSNFLVCGLLEAVLQRVLFHWLANTGHCARLAVLNLQTQVSDLCDVGLARRLILITCGKNRLETTDRMQSLNPPLIFENIFFCF